MINNLESVKLGNICTIGNGKTPSKLEQRDQGFPVLKIRDIDENGHYNRNGKSYVEMELAKKYPEKIIQQGDILILNAAHSSSYVGSKKFFADSSVEGMLATGEWTIIRANKDLVLPKYVYHYLSSSVGSLEVKNRVKGIHLYPKDLKDIYFPLRGFNDQTKVVKRLDQVSELVEKRKEAINLLDEYLRSLFLDTFGDPISNPKGWSICTIKDIVKTDKYSIKRGPFGGSLKKDMFVDDGYLVYEQYHALNRDFSFGRYYINDKKFEELKAFEVKAGDIIISCSGVYLGKLAEIPQNSKKGIINQALLKISLDQTIMRNRVFIDIFTNPSFKSKYIDNKIGSGIPNFPPIPVFKTFKFICPDMNTQNDYEKKVNEVEDLRIKMLEEQLRLEELTQSLKQSYFSY